ncbi:HAD-IA family hydrolase [Sphaerisporangium sp. NPDC049003]|uniref:HAD-IA family hydrolase n=1 Tax=Sphaerisporangium sp. NPDC049003 TaxID=3364517 RepID=UPI00371B65AC
MTSMPVRGLLVDLDGVVRLWRGSARTAEAACDLPVGAVREIAYDSRFDLAHVGVLTQQEWVEGVRERLVEKYGPGAAAAADIWSADRGEVDPAMVGLLRRARAAGLVVATLTNNTTVLDSDLRLHGLADLFDHVVNSADTGLTKPSPPAYARALTLMDLPAGLVAYTDDSPANVHAAAHVGLHAHLYTSAAALETFLAGLGVRLPDTASAPPPGRPAPAGIAPPTGHAESDEHAAVPVRYLASSSTPQELADRLIAAAGIAAAPVGPHAVATVCDNGTLTTWRLLPPDADARHAAGHSAAWGINPQEAAAEHLPPWRPATRAVAAPYARRLLHHAAWALHHTAAHHRVGDTLAAACAMQETRQALTELATLLARHQMLPWPGTTATRYLPGSAVEALTSSWSANPLLPGDLPRCLQPLITLLRHLRHTAALVLDADADWPWHHTAAALAPLFGQAPELTPLPPGDALYTTDLAAVYDRHRPVVDDMALALRALSAEALAGQDVIELGAGTGRITSHLAGHGPATYTATEPSPAMAERLTARRLPDVRVVIGDALALPLPDASADTVIEHEALLFTPDPLLAADRILRLLRPGGSFIRLLLHPDGPNPPAALEAAYRTAAFRGRPMPLIYGKGTDQRITAHMSAQGLVTTVRELARFTARPTPAEVLSSLTDRAWPYQHRATPEQHAAGLAAAHHAARAIPAGGVPVRYTLRALVTTTTEASR